MQEESSMNFTRNLTQSYQVFLDKIVPWLKLRWFCAVLYCLGFLVRVLLAEGWYIVTYALGIYYLNLLIPFLTPKRKPPLLPTSSADEEFRPFVRQLSEFKFWCRITKSTSIAWICTFFECFDVPVYWPVLLLYFMVLFCVTMRKQIRHMIKYRYLPYTYGKPKYQYGT